MKKSLLKINGLMALAVFSLVLLISSPVAATPSSVPFNHTDAFSDTPNIEFAKIVAGKGSSVYASLFVFGGVSGTDLPVDGTADAFSNAQSWFVLGLKQEGFSTYLNRAPSPVGAPDGISLHLQYSGASVSQTFSWAGSAAAAVESAYGITFDLSYINTAGPVHSYVFFDNVTSFSGVSSDVEGITSDGFSARFSASTVDSAPVGWAGYGARSLAGSQVAMYGMGWVDADGITENSGEYTISTANIFGGELSPNSLVGLSRASITVPYPIEPSSITPMTSNPLPHVTGIMEWDLRHPIAGYSLGAQSDMAVTYTLKNDNSFPNVQNTFSVDQTKLNQEGILEGVFDLKNIGDADAKNIDLYFPLGPDFDKIAGNKSIYVIKPDYYLNESFSAKFDISIDVAGVGTVTQDLLDYTGWYYNNISESIADWSFASDSMELFSGTVSLQIGSTTVTVTVNSDNGFPTAVTDALNNIVKPKLDELLLSGASISDLPNKLLSLKPALKTAFNASVATYYEQKPVFLVHPGDFQLHTEDYWVSSDEKKTYWFLTASVDSLAAGASTQLKFDISNIPTEAKDTFQFIDYNGTLQDQSLGPYDFQIPDVTVVSSVQNYYEFMQYMFQLTEYDGRPLSYGFDNSISFGTDLADLTSFASDNYISQGGIQRFENTEGFPFFGLSNSLNLQIGDDEALITAKVSLDSQVYHPGDIKTITVDLENTGDISAENVKVHLYHATLGRGYRFDRVQKIATIDVGSLASGASTTLTETTEANSFVGYSPVFAYVEFDSDYGQGPQQLKDFLDVGITEYEAAAQTHQIVTSTLTGALLTPESASLNPTVKEPRVEISKDIGTVDFDSKEFKVTYTVENTGEADTTVYFGQVYDTNQLGYVSHSTSSNDALTTQVESSGYGVVVVSNMYLEAGESATVTVTFKMLGNGATLWPAFAYFTIAGESSLGASINTGVSQNVGGALSSLFGLSAGSAAQQESQKSATEDSASSSFSASSSVGAAVNPNVNTDSVTATPVGFIGYNAWQFLGLMLIPLGLFSLSRRRKY